MRAFLLAAVLAAIGAVSCGKTLRPGYCRADSDCVGMGSGICDNAPDGGTFTCGDGGASDASVDRDGSDAPEAGDASDGPIEKPFTCTITADCADAGMSGVCEAIAGKCVECLIDSDCTATTTPVCDKAANMCVRCTTDAQCVAKAPNPGVCMFHQDGRCASDSETIYVKNSVGCSMTMGVGGTQSAPYCFSQLGIESVTMGSRVVVMRGPDPLRFWTFAVPGDQVTVIGQGGATIAPGADVGVRITAGRAYLRDLKIAGASNIGVVAEGGSELQMHRCVVENNSRGGILIDGASFDIRNTTVTGNGPGTLGPITWGGMLVNNPPAGGLNELALLTIENNKAVGISCSVAVDSMGILASGNLTGDINPTCDFLSCGTASATCGAQP
jgi:hypothetical protein